jgi:hypothetical protein
LPGLKIRKSKIATIRPGRVDGNDGKFGIRQEQQEKKQFSHREKSG